MFRRVNNNKFGVIEYAIDDEKDLDKLPKGDTNNTVYAILRKDGKNLIYLYSKEVEDYVLINGDLEEINTELESINEQLDNIANNIQIFVEDFKKLPSDNSDSERIQRAINKAKSYFNSTNEGSESGLYYYNNVDVVFDSRVVYTCSSTVNIPFGVSITAYGKCKIKAPNFDKTVTLFTVNNKRFDSSNCVYRYLFNGDSNIFLFFLINSSGVGLSPFLTANIFLPQPKALLSIGLLSS